MNKSENKLFQENITSTGKLVVLIIVMILTIFGVLSVAVPDIAEIRSADIGQGEITLRADSELDYESDLFLLNGQWEYYPDRLLFSEDFTAGSGHIDGKKYVRFPHYWRNEAVDFPDKGFATYRIVIHAPFETSGAGVYSEFQYGAYRIFLNGILVGSGGNISEDPDKHFFAYNGSAGYIRPSAGDYYEVIVQVQSYDHIDAGLANNIIMGSPAAIAHYSAFVKALTSAVLGVLLMLAVYFLLIFIFNTGRKKYLNFAIVAFCGVIVALTNSGENYAYYLIPQINARLLYSVEFLALLIGTYFAAVHVIQKHIKFKYIREIGIAVIGLNCLLVIVLQPYTISTMRTYFSMLALGFVVVAIIAGLINLIKTKNKEKDGSLLEFISLAVLLGGYIFGYGFTSWAGLNTISYAIVIYSFIQVFVLAEFYKGMERDLVKLAKTLENRVDERTAELIDMNRRVESTDRVKSEFLARMSHELRTPMNAIVGISELFDTGNLSEVQKNYFRDIKDTSHSILNLINDIMDYSRIEAGRMELVPTHFSLNSFVENICSTAKLSAQAKSLEFESEISENLPEFVYCDEVRTKQVITNVISNAVKYTRKGSVKLDILAADRFEGEGYEKMLLFTVTDTGIGMKRENIPRMFDAFMNPESGKSRGLKGSGLGLAICKSLMDMMGGKIDFDSEEGKGSVFKLYFPLVIGDGSQVEEVKVSEKIYAKNAKVLIVEDNTINVTVALGIFAAHDIRPDVAKDGYKALSMIKQKDYDMVFMDQFLPGIDGIETTRRIRELGGKRLTLPIVAMTANVAQGVRDMMIFKGMNDYIAKPVDHSALNNVLIRWLPHDKTCSSLGRFKQGEEGAEPLVGLPVELIAITEINCNTALKNADGSVEIFMRLLRRFAGEVYDYVESLNKYLSEKDLKEYIIVINGVKNLLYNIGAKASGDMATRLEKAATKNDEQYLREKNEQFCENLRWLSQKILLALPYQSSSEDANNKSTKSELVKLAGIMQDLSFDYSIGDCESIDGYAATLKSSSFGEEYEELISGIISETVIMEYEKAAEICKKVLNLLLDE